MSLCLENEGIFENLRRTLYNKTTFEARDAFDKVDIKNEGFVSSEAVSFFHVNLILNLSISWKTF